MSVRIKVSYTDDKELMEVLRILSPMIRSYKIAKQQKGAFKRAYIDMKQGFLYTALVKENQEKCCK